MKTTLARILAGLLVCASCAVTAGAATLQWSVTIGTTWTPGLQLISDGSGGCALVFWSSGVSYGVMWLDNEGAVRYSKSAIPSAPILMACEKNGVVFCYQDGGGYYRVISVDKKGNESTRSAPGEDYVDLPAVMYGRTVQRRSDSKGYFVEHVTAGLSSVVLERYSFK